MSHGELGSGVGAMPNGKLGSGVDDYLQLLLKGVDERRRGGSDGAVPSGAGAWPRQHTVTWRTPSTSPLRGSSTSPLRGSSTSPLRGSSTSPLRGSSPPRAQARGRGGASYTGGGSGLATPMAHSSTPRLATASCASLSGHTLSGHISGPPLETDRHLSGNNSSSPRFNLEDARALALLHAR